MTDSTLASLEPDRLEGEVSRADTPGGSGERDENSPVDGGTWYTADSQGSALVYDLPPGALADATYLATDFLLDGPDTAMFRLALSDGEATFTLLYGVIPYCAGRVRLPLDALDQHRSGLEREGAWCKPMIRGDRVDPADVERIELALVSDPGDGVRWCQSPLSVTAEEPPRLTDPALPEGPLLDEFGQATFREWDGRTESEAELVERLREQRDRADEQREIADEHAASDGTDVEETEFREFDDWGGRTVREFTATGFFRTHYAGGRWWLVTPDGHPFWSVGIDVVSPTVSTRYDGIENALAWLPDEDGEFADAFEHWDESGEYVDFLVANLIRAFGDADWREAWAEIALGQLRDLGFNTVGNWSDWEAASEAGVPYTRPLEVEFPETPTVFRDFPDVYHDAFPGDAADVAAQLEPSVGDPAMVGYFLGNEPDWRAGSEPVAVAMLHATESCATRDELADWLADRYGLGDGDGAGATDEGAGGAGDTASDSGADSLAETWEMDVTLADVREGSWDEALTEAARSDLELFSSRMVDRLYGVLGEACREVDPDHLNLGNRLVDVPADWVLEGMDGNVDVLTCNCYRNRLPAEYATVSETVGAPILVGEFHFGAPDVGLPFPSLQPVSTQAARGAAYRYYVEHAATQPWCVGTHYFTMYDESALGRFDGENMNIGFFDVCHRPYEPLADAAREAHDRLYALARAKVDPYSDAPAYLTSR
jgi:hypothetical protein